MNGNVKLDSTSVSENATIISLMMKPYCCIECTWCIVPYCV